MLDGALLVDKPAGWTSHDVVARLRRIAGQRRVGHTGTLDPLATGLMVCLLGPATRLSPWLTGMDKSYFAEARLGLTTDTYDIEGRETARSEAPAPDAESLSETLDCFLGDIEQTPPLYSAIKVKGRRLHQYARKGEEVEIPRRVVRIDSIGLIDYAAPTFHFECRVSSGAYIRSLIHDVGQRLECGATMTGLRRLSVGPFRTDDALPPEVLTESRGAAAEAEARQSLSRRLMNYAETLPFLPCFRVDADGRRLLVNGRACDQDRLNIPLCEDQVGEMALLVDEDDRAVALAKIERLEDGEDNSVSGSPGRLQAAPKRVFATS